MFRDGPKPPPGVYNPGQWNDNPGQTIPGPYPSRTPVAWWVSERFPLPWTAGAGQVSGANVSFQTATWGTPVFDLRPELRGSDSRTPLNSVPIWRGGYGAGGHLVVQVEGINDASGTFTGSRALRVRMQEFGHIFDAARVQSLSPNDDVTPNFVQGGDSASAAVVIFPPGDGYPVRFWRVVFTFDKTEDIAVPNFTISGVYY